MNFDKATGVLALKVVSAMSTGLFAGGAMYVSVVENPARMTHDPASAITMWKPSFTRAKSYQSKLCMLASFSSFGIFGLTRGDSNDAISWLSAGAAMFSILPITYIFIVPLNQQLIQTEKCISVKGDNWIVENLNKWNNVHCIRSFISLGVLGFVTYTLIKN